MWVADSEPYLGNRCAFTEIVKVNRMRETKSSSLRKAGPASDPEAWTSSLHTEMLMMIGG